MAVITSNDLASVSKADLFAEAEKRKGLKIFRECLPRSSFSFTSTDEPTLKILVVDTETTGLDQAKDEVIEFAGILVEVEKSTGKIGKVLDKYSGFQEPSKPITQEITNINGITNEMVKGHALDAQRIAGLFQSADLICAHNAGFDRGMMDSYFEKNLNNVQKEAIRKPWVCSHADVDWNGEGYHSGKLELLTLQSGFYHNAHRALDDVWALLYVIGSPLKTTGSLPTQSMIASAFEASFYVEAANSPFDSKDTLKANGFSFDWDKKVWGKSVRGDSALSEVHDFLAQEVYNKANASFKVFTIEPLERYSNIKSEPKTVPVYDPDHPFSSSAPAP